MADSLDDFFAKKDKKKGKGKTAVLSAGALVKELEEGAKQTEYPVRKEAKTSTAIELLGLDADDADWRDFEDIEKRDYTGLKVKEMSLQDQTEEDQRRLSADQTEPVPDATAWRIKDDSAPPTETDPVPSTPSMTQQQPQQPAAPATTTSNADNSSSVVSKAQESGLTKTDTASPENPEAKPDQTTGSSENPAAATATASTNEGDKQPSAKPKVYVPPHERNLRSGGGGEVRVLEPVRLSKMKTASTRNEKMPEISDETHFPSLG